MKTWRNLLICLAVFAAFWIGYDFYLSGAVSAAYKNAAGKLYDCPAKDNGVILQQTGLNRGDVLILGSSELYATVRQNPKNFFPNRSLPKNIFCVGRAGVLSLEHTFNIQALDFSQNKKLVYLVSFAWFTNPSVDSDSFYANFSKNKFYGYMTNAAIPAEDKLYTASRVSDLLRNRGNTLDLDAWVYSKLCKKLPFAFDGIQAVSYPYLLFQRAVLSTRDKAQSLLLLNSLRPDSPASNLPDVNWKREGDEAEKEGREKTHDNRFYFDDAFKNYMSDKIANQKNINAHVNLEDGAEYSDYNIFLKTCKRKGLKPLIIVQSVNGWYYDYTGINKDQRAGVYKRLCDMAQSYGFTAYDLSSLEYTPHAYYDAWHLGWKGWLYVDEKIAEYFSHNL